jgi:hypothetical protein
LKSTISDEIKSQLEPINAKLESLELVVDMKTSRNSTDVKKLESKLEELNAKFLDTERQNKACNLLLVGLPPLHTSVTTMDGEENKQDEAAAPLSTPSHEDKIIQQILETFDQAGLQNIHRDHFLSVKTIKQPGMPNRILIKTRSEKVKINIFKQKKLLKKLPYKLFINEDLTKTDGNIYKRARDHVKQGILHSTWTKGGKVYAKSTENGTPYVVSDSQEH